MLEIFYRWLVWNSSSPGDINHKCWELVELYLKSKPNNPFNLEDLYIQIRGLESETANIIRNRLEVFVSRSWPMVLEGGQFRFEDRHLIKDTDVAVLVSFSLTESRVVTYL